MLPKTEFCISNNNNKKITCTISAVNRLSVGKKNKALKKKSLLCFHAFL